MKTLAASHRWQGVDRQISVLGSVNWSEENKSGGFCILILDMRKTTVCQTASLKGRIAESRNRLYRVALAWCGDEMLADDLVQETMANGIVNLKQLRDERRLFAWLYSILNNNWRLYLRRKKNHDELDEQLCGDEFGPAGTYRQLEIVRRVRSAVVCLPIEQRQVISLVDLEEFSYCDVAKILDIPIGTVMSRLHRARKNLLSQLDKPAVDATNNKPHMRIVK
jgi:RNA polymerase sigma-70 factor (ECF subfamily)